MVSDAREVYEAVLDEVNKELVKLTVQYEEKIVGAVVKKLNADKIIETIAQYERRINELEQRNESLEKMILEIQSQVSKSPASTSSNVQKAYARSKNDKRIDMSRFDIEEGYKYDGWIYYANEEMGDFLYRVRTDGTDNQQLTDYSVTIFPPFRINNGELFFYDANFNEHSIII